MNSIIVNLVKFPIFTFLILIYICELRCTVIFPTLNATQFRQNFRILNKTNRMAQFHRKLNVYTPRQFATKQKFVSNETVDMCVLKNCQQNDTLIIRKLKIRRGNSVSNKLPNNLNRRPLQKMEIGK